MKHERECEPCNDCYMKGCRCEQCTVEHRKHEKVKASRRRNPDLSGWDNPRVSPERARNHLIYLASKGIGTNAIHRQTGLKQSTISNIRLGRLKFILKQTETIIISQAVGMYNIDPHVANKTRTWVAKLGLPKPYRSKADLDLPDVEVEEHLV